MIIYSKLEINRIKDFWELLNRLDTVVLCQDLVQVKMRFSSS